MRDEHEHVKLDDAVVYWGEQTEWANSLVDSARDKPFFEGWNFWAGGKECRCYRVAPRGYVCFVDVDEQGFSGAHVYIVGFRLLSRKRVEELVKYFVESIYDEW